MLRVATSMRRMALRASMAYKAPPTHRPNASSNGARKNVGAQCLGNSSSTTPISAEPSHDETSAPVRHSPEDTHDVSEHVEQPPPSEPHPYPKFFFKGPRGSSSSEYYVTRSNAGHPDPVAALVRAGRADPEWMWLKLLCFLCVASTFGTTIYGYLFAEHVKYFKDEPWSPFTY